MSSDEIFNLYDRLQTLQKAEFVLDTLSNQSPTTVEEINKLFNEQTTNIVDLADKIIKGTETPTLVDMFDQLIVQAKELTQGKEQLQQNYEELRAVYTTSMTEFEQQIQEFTKEKRKLESNVASKEEEIKGLTSNVALKGKSIEELTAKIQNIRLVVEKQFLTLLKKNEGMIAEIAKKNAEIAKKNAEIAKKNAENAELTKIHDKLTDMTTQLRVATNTISEKDKQLKELIKLRDDTVMLTEESQEKIKFTRDEDKKTIEILFNTLDAIEVIMKTYLEQPEGARVKDFKEVYNEVELIIRQVEQNRQKQVEKQEYAGKPASSTVTWRAESKLPKQEPAKRRSDTPAPARAAPVRPAPKQSNGSTKGV
jgi:chromosome segregation ATPase